MKQPIENLTLFFINKKPIDFLSIYNIIFLNFSIVLIVFLLLFKPEYFNGESGKYLSIIIMINFIFFDTILIKNFIEDKKGASDYIGYTGNYIQYRLPEYNIQYFGRYYFSRKVENNIMISDIQHIKLKPHHWLSFNNMTTKTETSIIFTLNQGIKKLRANIEYDELNHFAEQFEQFAHSRHIEIQSFRT
ncbi:MAG: hypothetical protein IK065_07285 [Neisseriaceae bacterium]|nr:hypothetical protein [Neisseriaceae bacterium]